MYFKIINHKRILFNIKPTSVYLKEIETCIAETFADAKGKLIIKSWEENYKILLKLKSKLIKKSIPEWLAKRVVFMLIDPHFQIEDLRNNLLLIDKIYQQIEQHLNISEYNLAIDEDKVLLALELAKIMNKFYKGSYKETASEAKNNYFPSLVKAMKNYTKQGSQGLAPSRVLCTQVHKIFSLILDVYGLDSGATAIYIKRPDLGNHYEWHLKTHIQINKNTVIVLDRTNKVSALGHVILNYKKIENIYLRKDIDVYEELLPINLSFEEELEVLLNDYFWHTYQQGSTLKKDNIRKALANFNSLENLGNSRYSLPLRSNIQWLYNAMNTFYPTALSQAEILSAIDNILKLVNSYYTSNLINFSQNNSSIDNNELSKTLNGLLFEQLPKYAKTLRERELFFKIDKSLQELLLSLENKNRNTLDLLSHYLSRYQKIEELEAIDQ